METENSLLNTPKTVKSSKIQDRNLVPKVRVIIRVRPFLPHEIASKNGNPIPCVSLLRQDFNFTQEVTVQIRDPETIRNECYQLDSFFGQEDNSVSKIFEREVCPLIPGIFCGFNATVFAYGATGSGKTYAMQGTTDLLGLMPLSVSKILAMSAKTGSTVEVSYYEVYMERCYDLLEVKGKEIMIMDDKDGQIHLKGLSRVQVSSLFEFNNVFALGIQRRKIAHTGLNDVSSRSHGVLVISVSTSLGNNGNVVVVTGKLNLIDLAGNEDNRRTCNHGIRLQESAKINQSLFALSNVIHALNNDKPRVPYRDSKLTRILQDSLGGSSRALMVACLNPGEYQESVHTVSLAARSRHLSTSVSSAHKLQTPKIQVDMEEKLKAWLESKGKTKRAQSSTTPLSNAVKKLNYHSSVKARVETNRVASNVKHRGASSSVLLQNLFNEDDLIDSQLEGLNSEYNNQVVDHSSAETSLQISTGMSMHEDKKTTNAMRSPTASKNKSTSCSPLRKVLSPINSNLSRPLVELECPVTPSSTMTCSNGKLIAVGTPLEKFSALSCNLKNALMQEYIEFLNAASREELQDIKGIGPKLAEYIVELRESSPLKSINDLEKIGLSSKQVYNMFNRAAQGMFAMRGNTNANA